VQAQDNLRAVHLTAIPPQGIVLDKGWKFQAGDLPAFAETRYDDTDWESIDPTKDVHDLPQLWKNNIVWFRLRFTVDTAINSVLAMQITQAGASQMYLNGKLIHRFGVVSTNPNEVKAFSPMDKPVSLPVDKGVEQVLAVRYALQPDLWYSTAFVNQNLGLRIAINTIENANIQYHRLVSYDIETCIFRVGVFSILGILYLAFYLFYRTRKVNLYFSFYAFFQVVAWSGFIYFHGQNYVQYWFAIQNFLLIEQTVGLYFLLTAIYKLLEHKKGWIYYSLIALGAVSILLGAFVYGWGWFVFGFLFTNLVNLEITRIAVKAVRNGKKGAWIVALGCLSFVVFWLLFCVGLFGVPIFIYALDAFTLAVFSIPVAVSIYLGYDFALTNRSLQQKFVEVERLSEEKQQILLAQKEVLEQQVTQRTAQLKQSLEELRTTQAQLVQQEKMASLGELTAGIAHEIQNPLNFVNNFSEVNTELIEELQNELHTGNTEEAIGICNDLRENEQKINHHGKRADSIVKGMLQHSRASSGNREPTDINALADEYLRLSYQGLRAKNKDFKADFKTRFDESIGKVEVVPQEIGRVLLNLYNNAFYSVNEKKKAPNLKGENYEPTVWVTTKRISTASSAGALEISVKDNGVGIPQKVVDRIFQPFFTTKPTGQGTGLGLSLSYDIIKAHGGELKVETKEGEGAEFKVILSPMVSKKEL
jgi:signal transduction histidine kinase